MAPPKITFYVDIISPFGYIAYWMLRNSPVFANVEKTYIPVLLGGLHKQCGNVAPILIKNKDKWINKERDRWAQLYSIPIRQGTPPGFPTSTVSSGRALTSLSLEVDQEQLAKAADVFWAAMWCPQAEVLKGIKEGRNEHGEFDTKDPKTLETLLSAVLDGEIAKKVMGSIGEKQVKDLLVANTNGAFEKGAFGLPWFECTNKEGETEGFWGFDHLGHVVRFLELEEEGDKGRSGQVMRAML
ncbi:hypothetical protein LTR64_005551 [Lithohypha guttulata]|uniref:uncharacterized protein n=1 Tax=Lithohypha guttulata TaxID=1690604 RepID=UPI002DE1BA64|nr:hypothetical protein LTR51_002656 [Lithohypha guttulata]